MRYLLISFILLPALISAHTPPADTIRGKLNNERIWWDVQYYNLAIELFPETKTLSGSNRIVFSSEQIPGDQKMQIDLMEPMHIDSVFLGSHSLRFERFASTSYHVYLTANAAQNSKINELLIYFSGQPIVAKNAPWDGGIVWSKDSNGKEFIASAVQGIGPSAWWPCKDHWSDEPDLGMKIQITTPAHLMSASNGILIQKSIENGKLTTNWEVKNPINSYGVNFNAGDYVYWDTIYKGEKGDLPVSFYALRENEQKAREHFTEAFRTLEAFEYWFGPYPFYSDGYKLVEVPYLGMEHQSCVTYGNGYQNGYLGRDQSLTGWGLKFDFIIVHESGHEWFANNITAKDNADMWIHESFTAYSEALFVEYHFGKEAGFAYARGVKANILNDQPIIGTYDSYSTGSFDMYYKGSSMLHMIRILLNNDEKWHALLRNLNQVFYHQTVTTKQIEDYISGQLSMDLAPIFDQYLRQRTIPTLQLTNKGKKKTIISWSNSVQNFNMPVDVQINIKGQVIDKRIYPTTKKSTIKGRIKTIDPNYLILLKSI